MLLLLEGIWMLPPGGGGLLPRTTDATVIANHRIPGDTRTVKTKRTISEITDYPSLPIATMAEAGDRPTDRLRIPVIDILLPEMTKTAGPVDRRVIACRRRIERLLPDTTIIMNRALKKKSHQHSQHPR